jgi:2-haloalkanoic acid dehalogenase type II
MRPTLLTFDIFGTVVDWRRGLREAVGHDFDFDRVVDWQGAEEQRAFRPYREIVADSLVAVLGMDRRRADEIGRTAGRWPLFPDSREGLRRLMKTAPCVAMTNSDREHGEQVQEQLGFRLTGWVCAEEVGVYKPAPAFWHATADRRKTSFGPHWWHVTAYADYDLEPASKLGLTTVFVPRPHARPGPATRTAKDLMDL